MVDTQEIVEDVVPADDVATEEPAVEDVEETGADDAVAEEPAVETYTQEQLLEAMAYAQKETLEAIRKDQEAANAANKVPETPVAPKQNVIEETLTDVLGDIPDDTVLTGADFKVLLTKVFTTIEAQGRQQAEKSEVRIAEQGTNNYAKEYVPKMVAYYKLDPNSIEAEYIENSFYSILNQAKAKHGNTVVAVQEAATQHMLRMKEKFGAKTKIPANKLPLDKKIAAGNNVKPEVKAKIEVDNAALAKKLQDGTLSWSEKLRLINSRK